MVIGNGMIARQFSAYRESGTIVIFASGVSNSKNLDDAAYQREKTLLQETIHAEPDKVLVYFSTCSIYDPDEQQSKYVTHKKEIEAYIQEHCGHYYIFRVSNLAGNSGNPNTILNFFIQHIRNRINFHLWCNATRNLLDIDDMYKIVDYIIQHRLYLNEVVNVANPRMYTVREIIEAIENWWKVKANFIAIDKGTPFSIDTSLITPVITKTGISFDDDYLINLLRKYYSQL